MGNLVFCCKDCDARDGENVESKHCATAADQKASYDGTRARNGATVSQPAGKAGFEYQVTDDVTLFRIGWSNMKNEGNSASGPDKNDDEDENENETDTETSTSTSVSVSANSDEASQGSAVGNQASAAHDEGLQVEDVEGETDDKAKIVQDSSAT